MGIKNTLMVTAASTLVGSAFTGKEALKKGFGIGLKIGITAGVAVGVAGTILAAIGKEKVEESHIFEKEEEFS